MKLNPPLLSSLAVLTFGIALAHAQDYDRTYGGTRAQSQDYGHDRYDGRYSPIHGQGHHSGREILARFHQFDDRIRDGIRSGELTRSEVEGIRSKEAEYRAKFDDFMQRNRGYLTDNEEASLNRSLDELSVKIRGHKHDDRYR